MLTYFIDFWRAPLHFPHMTTCFLPQIMDVLSCDLFKHTFWSSVSLGLLRIPNISEGIFQTIGYFSKYLFVALTCFNAFISSSFLSITFSYVIYCLFFLIYIGCYSIQFRLHLRAHWISAWWNLIPTLRNSHVFYVFFQARIVIHNYNCVLHLLYFIYNCI